MTYILLVMLSLGSGIGGFSAEFNSLEACQEAKILFVQGITHPKYYEEMINRMVCVPKGVNHP